MTTLKTYNPSVDELCMFLSKYSDRLFGSGATCIRLVKNVSRIANAYGCNAEISIFPRHIHLMIMDQDGNICTAVTSIQDRPADFALNTALSKLSWNISDREIDFQCAIRLFNRISNISRTSPTMELILVSLANASFCRLFGGDAMAMVVVFIATFAGYTAKQQLISRHTDFRITALICSFISAVLAAGDILFGFSSTPVIAIGTSILYLVPGIPFINSFCDMIDRHYICAMGRLMNAVVITCCLSAGLCAGMYFMNIGMF